tara:strand:- start:266 stop:958 length:693 start_codon:yes stop_codon:yes gene_type:complete
MDALVSVIIPTYNRFHQLLYAIDSVKKQTYSNIEIIIVNDGSTDNKYNYHKFEGCRIFNIKDNTKQMYNYPGLGYIRTLGMKQANGKYIAFLNDNDYWLPNKIQIQVEVLNKYTFCEMICSNAYIGNGSYNDDKEFPLVYDRTNLINIYKDKDYLIDGDVLHKWTYDFLKVHNFCITSSVMITNDLLKKVNYMDNIKPPGECYHCWLKVIQFTECYYIDKPLLYNDSSIN